MLKDIWQDKIDGVDDVLAEDINRIAHTAMENEENIETNTILSQANAEGVLENKENIAKTQEIAVSNRDRIYDIEQYLNIKKTVSTDEETAYLKVIPKNACTSAQLNSFGGMTYKSDNLIDYEALLSSNGFTKQDNGYWRVTVNGSVLAFENTKNMPGKISVSYIGRTVETINDNTTLLMFVTYTDGTKISIAKLGSTATNYTYISDSTDASKTVEKIELAAGIAGVTYEVKDIMINWGEQKVYEPYFVGFRDSAVTALKICGANLIDDEALLSSNGFTKQANRYWRGKGKTIKLFDNTEYRIPGKLSISYIGKPIETIRDYSIYILVYYTDGSHEYIGHLYSNNTSYVNISVSTNPDKVVQKIIKSSRDANDVYEIKDIMLNWGEPQAYKPYIEPQTIQIPGRIRALPNYGKAFTTVDLVNKKYINHCLFASTKEETLTLENVTYEEYQVEGTNIAYKAVLRYRVYNDWFDINSIEFIRADIAFNEVYQDNFYLYITVYIEKTPETDNDIAYWNEKMGTVECIWKETYYHINSPDRYITDISALLPEDFEIIEIIEGGGSIEFVNEYGNPVPSSISYMLKEFEG